MQTQDSLFTHTPPTPASTRAPALNDDGISLKGCNIIYAPKGQAGEYSGLAANPYRGCGHQCAYCVSGDTPILMADGTSRPIRDVAIGDEIFGIVVTGNNRAWNYRIAKTTILAKVSSHKQAYRISLADESNVICSADHRWLTERGWKYTTDLDNGQRPHLTANNVIRKVCNSAMTPPESENYRRGYLAGMIRGDANLAIYNYSHKRRKSGKTMGVQHRFRLALKDKIAITRTKSYLGDFGIETTDFLFDDNNGHRLNAIGTTSPERFIKIKSLIEICDEPEWYRGWLAGIFDAEGSHGKGVVRIANKDEEILSTTETAFRSFGFECIRDNRQPHASNIRLLGGRKEELRFWQLVNPAITRKLSIENKAVCDSVRVVSIDPLGKEIEMFDIMTGTENFVANGLISHNCYVPNVLHMPRAEFDAGAVERPNFLELLKKDAAKYQAAGITEQVMLSFTTDPYHLGDTRLTRQTLEVLQAHGLGICTLTKGGARALRDADLFRPDRDSFASTLTSLDDAFSRKWERGAALPQDRMDTLKKFHESGIFTWVSLEPVLDVEATLEIIRRTHGYVDLFKIGRVNYIGLTKTTDWEDFTHRVLDLVAELGVAHYIKRDLHPYLPAGYPNPMRVKQHH